MRIEACVDRERHCRPAAAAEDLFKYSCPNLNMGAAIRGLADVAPRILALMHGPSFSGDGGAALRAILPPARSKLPSPQVSPDRSSGLLAGMSCAVYCDLRTLGAPAASPSLETSGFFRLIRSASVWRTSRRTVTSAAVAPNSPIAPSLPQIRTTTCEQVSVHPADADTMWPLAEMRSLIRRGRLLGGIAQRLAGEPTGRFRHVDGSELAR